MERPYPTIEVLGLPVAKLDAAAALDLIDRIYNEQPGSLIAYANAHSVNVAYADPAYQEVLHRAGVVLNDGSGIALAARINGDRFPVNLNGTDFNPRIVELAAERGWRVYFLGGRAGVAARAAATLEERYANLQVAGSHDGYWRPEETAQVVDAIRGSGATVVMAALGNPLQEKWLDEHLPSTGALIGVGVGAFFDFVAGEVPRAPAWMNRWGIEWVFRLVQEPRRLWKRYVLGNPLFLARVLRERLAKR